MAQHSYNTYNMCALHNGQVVEHSKQFANIHQPNIPHIIIKLNISPAITNAAKNACIRLWPWHTAIMKLVGAERFRLLLCLPDTNSSAYNLCVCYMLTSISESSFAQLFRALYFYTRIIFISFILNGRRTFVEI